MKNTLLFFVIAAMFATGTPVLSQNRGGSADVQAAREELNSILDLGRLLGFVHTMSDEQAQLRLSDTQVNELLTIVRAIARTSRLTGAAAAEYMATIEDGILNTRQLVYTDQLWIAAERERANSGGTPSATSQQRGSGRTPGEATGSTTQGGSTQEGSEQNPSGSTSDLAAFAAGEDFNPLLDMSRPQGTSFHALLEYLEGRSRR
ncbi:MAG: hypothetical protein EA383_01635 [Spirochaetaceae bacterium]|nr:MAG: hypothetical protein EA383_01635 [Spirochaetaceae bacterium]